MDRLGLAELVDRHFRAHGNWQGLSPGRVLTGWLGHILSEGDHRLNQVQDWAQARLHVLQVALGAEVRALDFSDDRLASGLDLLSDDEAWTAFETALNQRTLRVYDLKAQRVRLDTTSASGYWEVTEDGLFQFGHSKDHRPDLPQVKVMVATLDPLGMPLVTQVVSGEQADDPLYIPAIEQVRTGIGRRGLLYVGDCKLLGLATRAHLVAGGDYYLAPLSLVQLPQTAVAAYLQPVWDEQQALTPIYRTDPRQGPVKIAEGFEWAEQLTTTLADGRTLTWTERRLVVRSLQQAAAATTALHKRLAQAEAAITTLNTPKQGKTPFVEVAALQQAAEALVQRYDVAGLLTLTYHETVQERHVRKYGVRPAETRSARTVQVTVQRHPEAIQAAEQRLGWRVYGTHQVAADLTLEQAVLAYRDEYLVERGFGRLKGRTLSLTPMYLADDDRATGLIRWLSVGLRVLTLLEGVVRQRLQEAGEQLAGLYAGNPKRATARPTAESLLRAFKGVALSFVTIAGQTYRHITPLSEVQHKILTLLDYPVTIYTKLAGDSVNPP
ncbi:MAG: IS1634 family transposase [Anaerolineae bacterium]